MTVLAGSSLTSWHGRCICPPRLCFPLGVPLSVPPVPGPVMTMNTANSAHDRSPRAAARQQTIDLQLPLSPPQLHALHNILRSAGAHAPSFRTRIGNGRIYVHLQVTDADEGPLSLDQLSAVRQQLGQLELFGSTRRPSVHGAPRAKPTTGVASGSCAATANSEPPPPSGIHAIVKREDRSPLAAAG
jgi:hypothetical protein